VLIEQPHFVHPDDVALAGQMRTGPLADPADALHRDYVAEARGWLEQHLLGEYNRAVSSEPGRWVGHDAPQIRELTEPYTDAEGIGTLTVHENPEWQKS
jgi:hypothetical protein